MIRRVGVVVPAADEELLIDRCLRSLRTACETLTARTGVVTDVVVVLDDCVDATPQLVAAHPQVTAVRVAHRNVGRTRAAGTAAAVARAVADGVAPADLWLASTDADSAVPAHWLSTMIALADTGADVVAGTVLPGPELAPLARAVWVAEHDQHDGHQHVHGANLGVRASALDLLGGWAPLATGEDVDLVERAARAGLHVERTGALAVETSARRYSRVPAGFAGYLRDSTPALSGADADGPGTEVTGAA